MRKILLSGVFAALVFSIFAQTKVGQTTYDLQTNVANCRRVATNAAGDLSITYTRSNQNNTSWSDRGTGYNYSADNGTTWSENSWIGVFNRPDSTRTGWPNTIFTDTKEVIASHLSGGTPAGGVQILRRDIGTGAWDKQVLLTETDATWTRMASSGDSIVVIYGLFTTIQPGMTAGGMGMYTSQDGGATWAGPVDVPMVNSTNFVRVGGDVYSIDMNSNGKIAIALGAYQVEVLTSTDFGTTFSKQTVVEVVDLDGNTNPLFDGLSGESMVQTEGGDGSYSVVVDDNDLVHLWFGRFDMSKDELTTTGVQYLPASVGLVYWNENMTAAKILHETRLAAQQVGLPNPLFSNQYFDSGSGWGTQLDFYRQSTVSMPSGGYSTNGDIFVSYSSMTPATFPDITDLTTTDNLDANGYHFRDIHIIKSSDNGVTWVGPINISNEATRECVYPGVPRKVFGANVPLIWQEDDGVGVTLQAPAGQSVPGTTNDIMFMNVDLATIVTPTDITSPTIVELETGVNVVDVYEGCDVDFASIFENDDVPTGPGVLDYQIVDATALSTPGTHTIDVYVIDAQGNSSDTIEALVTVLADNIDPIVTLIGPASVDMINGTTYTDPGIDYSDNGCFPSATPTVVTDLNENVDGTYTYTWTVTDNNGNTASVSRTVNVIATDNVDPVITPVGAMSETIEACSSYTDPGVTAFDNIDYDITTNVTTTGTVDPTTPGTYTLVDMVTDAAGNIGTITRTVIVEDNTAPEITVTGGSATIYVCKDGTFTPPNATATDCVDNSVTLTNNGNTVVNTAANGVYTVTYTAEDDYSNISTETVSVQVGSAPTATFDVTSDDGAQVVTVVSTTTDANYWEWNWNDPANTNSSFGQNATHAYATAGAYDIVLKVSNDFVAVCGTSPEALTTTKSISVSVGIAEVNRLNAIVDVYPNPSEGIININIEEDNLTNVEVSITNLIGEIITTKLVENTSNNKLTTFDLGNDAAGIYVVTISTENATISKKVIVK